MIPPDPVRTILQRSLALMRAGSIADARTELQAARLLHPADPSLALAFADCLHAEGRLPEAAGAYRLALKLNPDTADGWYGLGCAELGRKKFGAAAEALRRAAALAPQSGPAAYNLAKSLFELGRVGEAVRLFRSAAKLDPNVAPMAKASLACIIPGDIGADAAAIRRARKDWAAGLALATKPAGARHAVPDANRKLRIGYVSAFFGAANWMKPVFAVINRHDRDAFAIHMFCDGAPPSAGSGYADYPHDVVHDINGTGNEHAARIIAETRLDVLVDLNGYSAQERLPVLIRKPAAKIVGWFNMFATTGITAFDWLVGDDAVISPDEEKYYVERIHRVPGSYLAFDVRYPVPDVAPPPCIAQGIITFGCLGSQYKITDEVLDAWAAILLAAPQSRLFIKNGTLQDDSVCSYLTARLHGRGIATSRISLDGRSEHFEFLDAYRHVDIALDTFPYNGGTTTTEALWQGVPVLSFRGDRWASRTSASLLSAAGLHDWIMPDAHAYVQRAAALGNNEATAAMLSSLRASLRSRVAASAACDGSGLCRSLESFYRAISDRGPP